MTVLHACASINQNEQLEDDDDAGIAYPFIAEPESIGRNGPEESFVIKSAVGDREYSIQIPGSAHDYDVQVPIADIGETDQDILSGKKSRSTPNTVATDREMLSTMPRINQEHPSDSALVDSAFGVYESEGPKQAPSYTLGLARIKELYKRHQYELALIEANHLLTFFANSSQLNKMKGTLLIKLHNQPLAEKAWIRALELDPSDRALRGALDRLQKRLMNSGRAQGIQKPAGPPEPIPTPVGTPPSSDDGIVTGEKRGQPP